MRRRDAERRAPCKISPGAKIVATLLDALRVWTMRLATGLLGAVIGTATTHLAGLRIFCPLEIHARVFERTSIVALHTVLRQRSPPNARGGA